jgi:hypothetical protein
VQQLETQLLHMLRSYLIQVSVRSSSAPTTNSFVMTCTPVNATVWQGLKSALRRVGGRHHSDIGEIVNNHPPIPRKPCIGSGGAPGYGGYTRALAGPGLRELDRDAQAADVTLPL